MEQKTKNLMGDGLTSLEKITTEIFDGNVVEFKKATLQDNVGFVIVNRTVDSEDLKQLEKQNIIIIGIMMSDEGTIKLGLEKEFES